MHNEQLGIAKFCNPDSEEFWTVSFFRFNLYPTIAVGDSVLFLANLQI